MSDNQDAQKYCNSLIAGSENGLLVSPSRLEDFKNVMFPFAVKQGISKANYDRKFRELFPTSEGIESLQDEDGVTGVAPRGNGQGNGRLRIDLRVSLPAFAEFLKLSIEYDW